jgi:hypothetical protein
LTGPDAGHALDAVLADLVTGAERWRGEEADGTSGIRSLPEAEEVEHGADRGLIPPDRIDPADFARPVDRGRSLLPRPGAEGRLPLAALEPCCPPGLMA